MEGKVHKWSWQRSVLEAMSSQNFKKGTILQIKLGFFWVNDYRNFNSPLFTDFKSLPKNNNKRIWQIWSFGSSKHFQIHFANCVLVPQILMQFFPFMVRCVSRANLVSTLGNCPFGIRNADVEVRSRTTTQFGDMYVEVERWPEGTKSVNFICCCFLGGFWNQ